MLMPLPIVQAPMSGGPSTPALAAAVSEAGGLGFLAAGYKTVESVAAEIDATRARTGRPFGVNLLAPPPGPGDEQAIQRYAALLQDDAEAVGAAVGPPRHGDDAYTEKLALLRERAPAVVSFTFGCPDHDVVAELRRAGSAVWVTVTDPHEASAAADAGADAVVVQGAEAGGHRGSFVDIEDREPIGLLALVQLVRAAVALPLVGAGGIMTGAGIAAVLAAGCDAAALGTAFMRCPEAGTSAPHRAQLGSDRPTGLTRAFTGRLARGIVNRFQAGHAGQAPLAYPEVHHLTAGLRAAARAAGDAEAINLWAGQAHGLAEALPAAELVARLHTDARAAAAAAVERLEA